VGAVIILNLGYLFAGMMVIVGVLLLAVAVFTTCLCIRLKNHHHSLWLSLDRPMPGDRRYQTKYLRFLRLRQYESLGDSGTRRLAAWARMVNTVFLIYVFAGSAVGVGLRFT
jgi:hypothetical protein